MEVVILESVEDKNKREQIAKVFGANLLQLRKQKGYTREELAEKSNLSANYIYGLEKRNLPSRLCCVN